MGGAYTDPYLLGSIELLKTSELIYVGLFHHNQWIFNCLPF